MKTWLPKQIRDFRNSLGMTQEEFGELVGVTRIYVNYIEQGVRTPSKTLSILLNLLNEIKTKEDIISVKRKQEQKG